MKLSDILDIENYSLMRLWEIYKQEANETYEMSTETFVKRIYIRNIELNLRATNGKKK